MTKKSNTSWRNIKPHNPSDPVRHYLSSLHRIMDCYIVGASVRGKKHAHFGEWREDSFAGRWAILTIADGAGSAPLSRVGSRLAVRRMNSVLKRTLLKIGSKMDVILDEQDFNEKVSGCLKKSFLKALSAVKKESEKRKCPQSHLATTLLSVLYTKNNGKDLFFWLNVGDGVFGVFTDSNSCDVLCDEDHGLSAGETRFITSSGIIETLSSRVHHITYSKPVYSFALMTDGVSDDLYPLGNRLNDLIEGKVVGKGYMIEKENQLLQGIKYIVKNDNMDAKRLVEWLKYEKIGSTYDDRTLVVALKNR
jgi:serine/threonine protein phosphatase PrpC